MATIATIEVGLDAVGQKQLQDGLLQEIAQFFTKILKTVEITIGPIIRRLIVEAIESSPEYRAMLPGGTLYGQIGRPDIVEILKNIANAVAQEAEIKVFMPVISLDKVIAAMEINILDLSFDQVQRVSGTYFDSENDLPVDWLNWLLFEGDRRVVIGYHYTTSPRVKARSRTNTGIMGKHGSWGIPPEFAGTEKDNWLTRAMDSFEDAFVTGVESEFVRAAV